LSISRNRLVASANRSRPRVVAAVAMQRQALLETGHRTLVLTLERSDDPQCEEHLGGLTGVLQPPEHRERFGP
jgi:hypothetical protein